MGTGSAAKPVLGREPNTSRTSFSMSAVTKSPTTAIAPLSATKNFL